MDISIKQRSVGYSYQDFFPVHQTKLSDRNSFLMAHHHRRCDFTP